MSFLLISRACLRSTQESSKTTRKVNIVKTYQKNKQKKGVNSYTGFRKKLPNFRGMFFTLVGILDTPILGLTNPHLEELLFFKVSKTPKILFTIRNIQS
jgi:hypothetical protein